MLSAGDLSGLIERLREYADTDDPISQVDLKEECGEAADAIESLLAENERLRAAAK